MASARQAGAAATSAIGAVPAASQRASKPLPCARRRSRGRAMPRVGRCASRPLNSATSLPGRSGRCRSAISHVAVRRGSMTTTLHAGRAPCARHRCAGRAPGWHQAEIGADQHDEVGELEILVVAGHHVLAEGALVAGDRRRHAEPRIGVDVGGADEALHQLVGDVVVLGQQLARDVERDGVGPVLGDGVREASRRPGRAPRPSRRARPPIVGMEQPALERQRLAQRRALGAEPAAIGRVVADRRRSRRRLGRRASRRRRSRRRNRGRWCGCSCRQRSDWRAGRQVAQGLDLVAAAELEEAFGRAGAMGEPRRQQLLEQRRQFIEHDVAGVLARHRLLGGRRRAAADEDVIALDDVVARARPWWPAGRCRRCSAGRRSGGSR